VAAILTSERLILRDLTTEDWPAVHAYATRPEVFRYQPWGPNTPDESRYYVESAIAYAQEQPRSNYTLGVIHAATGEMLGACGIMIRSRQQHNAEIAYVLHPDHWGHGYATEAARLLLRFGFATLGLHRVFATCDPRNTASAHVLEKLGMTCEGRLREIMLIRDRWRDSLLYSLLDYEWQPHQCRHTPGHKLV
jgi:[ribosomal protein S5]-alanine N-acetyltransferase